jgi:hypothetical protein
MNQGSVSLRIGGPGLPLDETHADTASLPLHAASLLVLLGARTGPTILTDTTITDWPSSLASRNAWVSLSGQSAAQL